MNVLGINYNIDRSSAAHCTPRLITASLEQQFTHVRGERAFPHNSIRSFNEYVWDAIAIPKQLYRDARTHIRKHSTAVIVAVDYLEALSMATISATDYNCCAIIAVDSECVSLGYYADNSFYWILHLDSINSIATFSAAISQFLGYNVYSEDAFRKLSLQGNPKFATWMHNQFIDLHDRGYTMLSSANNGYGTAVPDADIAASAQAVINNTMVHLAQWLQLRCNTDKLAIVGRIAANYISNTAILDTGLFSSIATIPVSSGAAVSLGAAALLSRPLLEHCYIGQDAIGFESPEQVASALLAGNIVSIEHGKQEFSDNSFINRNKLFIPFDTLVTQDAHYHICQERDFASYYGCGANPTHGQYLSKVMTPKFKDAYARVVTVASNRNPFINRVLEITKQHGYPILFSKANL